MTENITQPAIELLVAVSAQTALVGTVIGAPLGDRMIFDATGGTFTGPQLSGRVLATGGDWVTRTATGSHINVRLLLQTHDGITVLLQYTGRACQDGDNLRLDIAGTFEAPQDSAYAWLNDVQAFGRGAVTAEGVTYHFYRFK